MSLQIGDLPKNSRLVSRTYSSSSGLFNAEEQSGQMVSPSSVTFSDQAKKKTRQVWLPGEPAPECAFLSPSPPLSGKKREWTLIRTLLSKRTKGLRQRVHGPVLQKGRPESQGRAGEERRRPTRNAHHPRPRYGGLPR